jgi:hypothetical protein
MITGNKTILKVGKIMGYVGLAGGLASMAVGGLGALASGGEFLAGAGAALTGGAEGVSSAIDSGMNALGSLFSSAPTGVSGAAEAASAYGGILQATGQAPIGAGSVLAPAESLLGTAASPYVGITEAAKAAASQIAMPIVPVTETTANAVPGVDRGLTEDNVGDLPGTAGQAPQAPAAPQSTAEMDMKSLIEQAKGQGIVQGTQGVTPPTNTTNMGDWFKSLPPALQASLALTGGQAISGLMGGLFQGMSAEKQLELQQVIADRAESQRQFQNANASYAPTLKFKPYTPPSLMNSAKRTA